MAKKGMARPEWTHTKPRNDVSPVPEIQGKAKHGKEHARPIISGTRGSDRKVYHAAPHTEKSIAEAYRTIDNDLAVENLTVDLPAADLSDV